MIVADRLLKNYDCLDDGGGNVPVKGGVWLLYWLWNNVTATIVNTNDS